LSPLEIKPGKRPGRIKPADVYPARGPTLSQAQPQPFPLASSLNPAVPDVTREAGPLLADSTGLHLPQAGIALPDVTPIRTHVDTDGDFQSLPTQPSRPSLSGRSFKVETAPDTVMPEPLPRAYHLDWREGKPHASSQLDVIDLLQPLLQPSVISEETADLILTQKVNAHQTEAVNAFLKNDSFLLADDPGTGKTAAVCLAVAAKMQVGQARRVLYVTSESGVRRAAAALAHWAPGLAVTVVQGSGDVRTLDWSTPAHVFLTDLESLKQDLEGERLKDEALDFDILVLDDLSITGLRFQAFPGPLARISTPIRWVLTGGLPEQAEDWIQLFSFLLPEKVQGTAGITLPDLKRRFKPYFLRRAKAELRESLDQRTRELVWLDLGREHAKLYEEVLAEERHRLDQLGEAISPAHIESAVTNLKAACNFEGQSLDGCKVRAVIHLVEQIAASGSKAVVFSQFKELGVERLQPVLEPYGVLRLSREATDTQRREVLQAFRIQPHWHVLLMETGARTDGEPLVEASYVIHYDHAWNPALRMRAELRLYPAIFRAIPITIYEFWVADSVDEGIFHLLAGKNLLPAAIPESTQPKDLEGRFTKDEWLEQVIGVRPGEEPERIESPRTSGTGLLPGTAVLREKLSELSPDTLMAAVETLMSALGYPETEVLDSPDEEGGFMLAWREGEQGFERVLVRCLQTNDNVGVAKARALLKSIEMRRDCVGAYLITTSDFTAACRKQADESGGTLALVSGAELYRHLHILGRF
jgi:hypothetical protein